MIPVSVLPRVLTPCIVVAACVFCFCNFVFGRADVVLFTGCPVQISPLLFVGETGMVGDERFVSMCVSVEC